MGRGFCIEGPDQSVQEAQGRLCDYGEGEGRQQLFKLLGDDDQHFDLGWLAILHRGAELPLL
jgi:hypothetical protein